MAQTISQQDEKAVLKTLRKGAKSVTSSYDISERTGVPQRSVGFVVSRLRKQGKPIGSIHGEGYFIIRNQQELEDTVAHIAKRKAGIDQTIKSLRDGFAGK
jgi:biotin operon repressor